MGGLENKLNNELFDSVKKPEIWLMICKEIEAFLFGKITYGIFFLLRLVRFLQYFILPFAILTKYSLNAL